MPRLYEDEGLWYLDARDNGLAVYNLETASEDVANAIAQTPETFFEWLRAHGEPLWPDAFLEIEGDQEVYDALQEHGSATVIRFHPRFRVKEVRQ